eukprot:TRINITY_DN2199_c0_g1_i1.p1 TRINITY_DN2199_c0_g1~~TRINITY_DN2199_c0_g1_i1.p1  ORF type:complete len:1141 (+),score=291.12 TRINITY_DN2199_c0_g1_i1:129-3551(+)
MAVESERDCVDGLTADATDAPLAPATLSFEAVEADEAAVSRSSPREMAPALEKGAQEGSVEADAEVSFATSAVASNARACDSDEFDACASSDAADACTASRDALGSGADIGSVAGDRDCPGAGSEAHAAHVDAPPLPPDDGAADGAEVAQEAAASAADDAAAAEPRAAALPDDDDGGAAAGGLAGAAVLEAAPAEEEEEREPEPEMERDEEELELPELGPRRERPFRTVSAADYVDDEDEDVDEDAEEEEEECQARAVVTVFGYPDAVNDETELSDEALEEVSTLPVTRDEVQRLPLEPSPPPPSSAPPSASSGPPSQALRARRGASGPGPPTAAPPPPKPPKPPRPAAAPAGFPPLPPVPGTSPGASGFPSLTALLGDGAYSGSDLDSPDGPLASWLCSTPTLTELVDLLTCGPSPNDECSVVVRARAAFVGTRLLEQSGVGERLCCALVAAEFPGPLERLWEFAVSSGADELDSALTGYFARVALALIQRHPAALAMRLRRHFGAEALLEGFLQRLRSDSMADVLLHVASVRRADELCVNVECLVPRLLSRLEEPESQDNIRRLIDTLLSRVDNLFYKEDLYDQLSAQEVMDYLLALVLQGSCGAAASAAAICSAVVVRLCDACAAPNEADAPATPEALVAQRSAARRAAAVLSQVCAVLPDIAFLFRSLARGTVDGPPTPSSTATAASGDSAVTVAPVDVDGAGGVLAESRSRAKDDSSHCGLPPRVGSGGSATFEAIKLVAAVARAGHPAALEALREADILPLSLELLLAFPWSGPLHNAVAALFSEVFAASRGAAGPAVSRLVLALLRGADDGYPPVLERVRDEFEAEAAYRAAPGRRRRERVGYMGHLRRIALALGAFCVNGDVSFDCAAALCATRGWPQVVEPALREALATYALVLGGEEGEDEAVETGSADQHAKAGEAEPEADPGDLAAGDLHAEEEEEPLVSELELDALVGSSAEADCEAELGAALLAEMSDEASEADEVRDRLLAELTEAPQAREGSEDLEPEAEEVASTAAWSGLATADSGNRPEADAAEKGDEQRCLLEAHLEYLSLSTAERLASEECPARSPPKADKDVSIGTAADVDVDVAAPVPPAPAPPSPAASEKRHRAAVDGEGGTARNGGSPIRPAVGGS